jgi:hypothetical protein
MTLNDFDAMANGGYGRSFPKGDFKGISPLEVKRVRDLHNSRHQK